MKALVMGITGNTGSATADALLQAGHDVRALVRSPEKAAAWADRGVELVQGDQKDRAALDAAFAGVDAAYVMIPPQWGVTDYFAVTDAMCDTLADAIEAADVPRVVVLSSISADLPAGTGPIRSVYVLEQRLKARRGVTLLRPAYFQENLGSSVPPVLGDGVLPVFFGADTTLEMVATRDIGTEAAKQLQVGAGAEQRIVQLAGPEPHTFRDVAALFARLTGREIQVVEQPPQALTTIMEGMGAGALAALYGEMAGAIQDGTIGFDDSLPLVRGTTPVEATLKALLAG